MNTSGPANRPSGVGAIGCSAAVGKCFRLDITSDTRCRLAILDERCADVRRFRRGADADVHSYLIGVRGMGAMPSGQAGQPMGSARLKIITRYYRSGIT